MIKVDYIFADKLAMITKLGLNKGGRVQSVIDSQIVHYLREYEPVKSQTMRNNTRVISSGLIGIQVPYAHYQNEGVLYIDPVYRVGAFHDNKTGRFWSRKNVSKIPSERLLANGKYRHFVERALSENFDKIMETAKREINKK